MFRGYISYEAAPVSSVPRILQDFEHKYVGFIFTTNISILQHRSCVYISMYASYLPQMSVSFSTGLHIYHKCRYSSAQVFVFTTNVGILQHRSCIYISMSASYLPQISVFFSTGLAYTFPSAQTWSLLHHLEALRKWQNNYRVL